MRAKRVSAEVSVCLPSFEHLPKIFVLGFNKCGTRSFAEVFERSGIGCVHWDSNRLARYIAKDINEYGIINLDKYYPGSNSYCDIISSPISANDPIDIVEGIEFFEQIYSSYPDAYFILNTRHVEDWILSRLRHERGRFKSFYKLFLTNKFGVPCDDNKLSLYWYKIWHKYHYLIIDFFESKNDANFLVYDISKSQFSDLVEFLSPSYSLLGSSFAQKGLTSYDNNLVRIYIIRFLRRLLSVKFF